MMGIKGVVGDTVGVVVELYCHVLGPFTILYGIRLLPYPAFLLGGIGQVFIYVLALLWSLLLEGSGLGRSIIALFVAYALMMLVSVSGYHAERLGEGEKVKPMAEADPYEGVLLQRDRISAQNGLTPRESEVLGYLMQSRTTPYIARELYVF